MVFGSLNSFGNLTKGVVNIVPPVITSVTNGTLSSVLIYFTPGTGGTITNYQYSSNGTTYTSFSPSQTTSPLTIPSLSNGTFNISIKSVSTIGISLPSNSLPVTVYVPFQGITRTQLSSLSSSTTWKGICCDTTGQYVMVAAPNEYIKFSSNFGNNFVDMSANGSNVKSNEAYRMACDRSGQYAAVCGYNNGSNFQFCTNCLSGGVAVWTQATDTGGGGLYNWKDVCFATDSTNVTIYALQQGGYVWKNTFSKTATSGQQGYPGVPLQFSKTNNSSNNYYGICCSSDGKYVATCIFGGSILYSSDYGVTWSNSNTPGGSFLSIRCSLTGQYMIAGMGSNNHIWSSQNYGQSWTQDISANLAQNVVSYIFLDDSGNNASFVAGSPDYLYYSNTTNISGGMITIAYTAGGSSVGSFGAGICGSGDCKYVYYTNGQTAGPVYRLTN
jgi:hypothetical protein